MSKYKFKLSERYAIWKSVGPLCIWCKEPVMYQHCQIDHVIPEDLDSNPSKLNDLINVYGLGPDFGLNNFHNWGPIHSGCNQSKQNKVFGGAPFVGQLLHEIRDRVPQTEKIYDQWQKEPKIAKILATLEAAILEKLIKEEDLNTILLKCADKIEPIKEIEKELKEFKLRLSPLPTELGWKVISRNEEQLFVEKDGRAGYTSGSEYPHLSWLCSRCFHYGPWDGNRCLNCGAFSYPD